MIYIDINKLNIIEAREIHIKELTPKILKKVSESQFQEIKDFLTEERIKHILEDFPNELYQIHCDFSSIINNVSITTALRKIIDYDNFIEKKKTMYDAYDLAEKLDIPTCPYCGRMYTKTVISEKGKKIVRPDFDHWFPKSEYPLLALSFYNLIPSCSVCNSGVKGSTPFELSTHFHPYYKSPDKEFKYTFSYDLETYQKPRVKFVTENDFSKVSVDAFELEEIYKTHQDEVEDLLKIRQAYSENYIDILNKMLGNGVNLSREEVYRLAFGAHLAEDKFDRRPLSKMKKDILTELGIIKPEMK